VTDRITRLVGVYDADGSVLGELKYFVGARLGRTHCSLCDVTHGLVRERPEWRATRDRLRAPFVTFHRDDQPPSVRAATAGDLPAVLAETTSGAFVRLAGPDELHTCAGSPAALSQLIESRVAARGLDWPEPAGV
jgi:hypothetical protein